MTNVDLLRVEPHPSELAGLKPDSRTRSIVYAWYDRYNELITYKQVHGDCKVPQVYPPNRPLGVWVYKQREYYKYYKRGESAKLTDRQVELLNDLDFDWVLSNPLETKRATSTQQASSHMLVQPIASDFHGMQSNRARSSVYSWYTRYNELVEYHKIHGDCMIPQLYPPNRPLGIWVNKQREHFKFYQRGKPTSLTPRKIHLLDLLNFHWGVRKGGAAWQRRLQELVKFKREFGHCMVPTKYERNKALGRWISTQRSEYKKFQAGDSKSLLNQERVDMLNSMGFCWDSSQETQGSVYGGSRVPSGRVPSGRVPSGRVPSSKGPSSKGLSTRVPNSKGPSSQVRTSVPNSKGPSSQVPKRKPTHIVKNVDPENKEAECDYQYGQRMRYQNDELLESLRQYSKFQSFVRISRHWR